MKRSPLVVFGVLVGVVGGLAVYGASSSAPHPGIPLAGTPVTTASTTTTVPSEGTTHDSQTSTENTVVSPTTSTAPVAAVPLQTPTALTTNSRDDGTTELSGD